MGVGCGVCAGGGRADVTRWLPDSRRLTNVFRKIKEELAISAQERKVY